MLFLVISASLLWITTCKAENEICSIPSILNGVAGKYIKVRFSRTVTFKEIDEGTKVEEDEDVYLRCSQGYEISGSNQTETKINCSAGRWSHELQCTPASCNDSPPITFLNKVREVEINREHGGSISYECIPDYVFKRDGNVTCQYGEWKGYPPACKPTKCETDSLQYNGVMKEPNQFFYDNEEYNYTCESPRYYKPKDHSGIAICKDGIFHLPFPLCSEKSCTDPPPIPEHGSVADLSLVHRAIVNYICEDPYVLEDDSIVQCFYGDWIGEPPKCRDSRCYLKDLENISPDSQPITLSGETLNVTCEEGYSLNGELPLCENGVWNRQLYGPLCKKNRPLCGKPPEIKHASITDAADQLQDKYEVGTEVIYTCRYGYVATGRSRIIRCDQIIGEAKWREPEFSCKQICSVPSILNGVVGKYIKVRFSRAIAFKEIEEGTKVEEDEDVYLRCSQGYEISGFNQNETKINCSEGRWSHELQCTPASCNASPPLTFFNNVREVEINRDHGGIISYECIPDHVFASDGNVTCEYGEWIGNPPVCKSKRCTDPPPIPEHGRVVDLSLSHRAVVNYACEDPYVLHGDSIVQCFYGDWIGEPPNCRDSRCYLEELENLMNISPDSQSTTLSGEALNVTCEEGYSLSGELPLCENGVWNRQLYEPLCKKSRCYTKDLGNLINLSPKTETSILSGDKLNVICVEGYSVEGELPTCNNGVWNRYLFDSLCKKNTCQVPNVPHGKLKEFVSQEYERSFWHFRYPSNGYFRMVTPGSTFLPNTVLHLFCENGYSFRGSGAQMVETQCFKGRYLPHPECQRNVPCRKGGYRGRPRFPKPWEVLE